MKKIISALIISVFLISYAPAVQSAVSAPVKERPLKAEQADKNAFLNALKVSPLDIVNNPNAYLNKTVSFSGEFVSFTSLGLDYKPAFRDSSKYIGFLIRRPDTGKYTIPLSEFKIFMTRETAEKNIDIEAGDKFTLAGRVFSSALGDPWLDITEFKITDKKNKTPKEK